MVFRDYAGEYKLTIIDKNRENDSVLYNGQSQPPWKALWPQDGTLIYFFSGLRRWVHFSASLILGLLLLPANDRIVGRALYEPR